MFESGAARCSLVALWVVVAHALEILVGRRSLTRDPAVRIVLNHLGQQVNARFIQARHDLVPRCRLVFLEIWVPVRKLSNSWPRGLSWSAQELENLLELVSVGAAWNKGTSVDHLC